MKSQITVIIPIWNLSQRGYERVKWSLYSLEAQTVPVKAIVYDASTETHNVRFRGKHVTHIRKPHKRLHIPFMMNRGIELAETEYIATTGADFVFKPNFFESCLNRGGKGKAVFCQVDEMTRQIRLNKPFIDKWEFDIIHRLYKRNKWQRTAPGAINFLHRDDWIKTGGYNEDFIGWGAYDNEFYDHSKKIVKPVWIEKQTQVIHLWHKSEKAPKGKDSDTWNANQKRYGVFRKKGREKGANWLKIKQESDGK